MNHYTSRALFLSATITTATASFILASPEDFVERGNALMQLSRDEMNPAYYSQAAESYSEALEIDPENTEAMLGLAWVENSNHNFENGESWAKKAINIDGELADAYSLLGDSYVEHGEYNDAFENYQRSLDLRPDLSSYSRAAHLVWLTGDRDKGMKLMQLAISSGSPHAENTAWCKSKLSIMLLQSGNTSDALELAQQAAEHAPRNPLVLANLGQIQRTIGNTSSALEHFEKSYHLQHTHESLANLYDLYLKTEKPELAEKMATELISFHRNHHASKLGLDHPELDSETGHGHHHIAASAQLAKFWLEHDLYPELALSEAKNAYHQYPNIEATDTLAWAYYKSGDFKNANQLIEKALKWSPPIPEIYYHAGAIRLSSGDVEEAERNFATARELNPQFEMPAIQTTTKTTKSPSKLSITMSNSL